MLQKQLLIFLVQIIKTYLIIRITVEPQNSYRILLSIRRTNVK